jgi:hypothetical protein
VLLRYKLVEDDWMTGASDDVNGERELEAAVTDSVILTDGERDVEGDDSRLVMLAAEVADNVDEVGVLADACSEVATAAVFGSESVLGAYGAWRILAGFIEEGNPLILGDGNNDCNAAAEDADWEATEVATDEDDNTSEAGCKEEVEEESTCENSEVSADADEEEAGVHQTVVDEEVLVVEDEIPSDDDGVRCNCVVDVEDSLEGVHHTIVEEEGDEADDGLKAVDAAGVESLVDGDEEDEATLPPVRPALTACAKFSEPETWLAHACEASHIMTPPNVLLYSCCR